MDIDDYYCIDHQRNIVHGSCVSKARFTKDNYGVEWYE